MTSRTTIVFHNGYLPTYLLIYQGTLRNTFGVNNSQPQLTSEYQHQCHRDLVDTVYEDLFLAGTCLMLSATVLFSSMIVLMIGST